MCNGIFESVSTQKERLVFFDLNVRLLSYPFSGVWPEGADGTDINAVCRSHDGSLLASADDFGKVHLFTYPCSQPRVSDVHS